MRQVFAGLALIGLLISVPTHTTAQVSGFAWAAFTQGPVFLPGGGFVGPFRGTETGIELQFAVLCMDLTTRAKFPREVTAVIPDGSSLADLRTFSTTAVINGCAEYGVTVPRGAVLLPAVNLGQ
jgi:hypothetical protein